MTYAFPESLTALRKYLKSKGFEGSSIKTSRQAAFVAQQLLGTRVKFPPQGEDMTAVLIALQRFVPAKKREPDFINAASELRRVGAENHAKAGTGKTPDQRSKKTVAKRKREALQKTFAPETFAEGVHVFCDGACEPNPGAGGWGVVVYRDGVEVASQCGGDPETTNNQMELTALLVAIEKAGQLSRRKDILPTSANLNSPDAIGEVTIWCDSQYCVKGCNEWRHGWKAKGWQRGGDNAEPKNRVLANADLWKAIDEALEDIPDGNVFSIRWVKGHAGVAGNERADELAEMGRQATASKTEVVRDDLDERYRQIMGAA